MSAFDSPSRPAGSGRREGPVGLALAGGGPEGAIYEIGALRALEDSLEGIELTDLDMYLGVSAGALVASCLANGIGPGDLCRAIVSHRDAEHPFTPRVLYTPAVSEWVRQGAQLPRLMLETLGALTRNPGDVGVFGAMTRLARALPTGLFDNGPVGAYLKRLFSAPGRTDDFRQLRSRLLVVAADLDSSVPVRFGEPGWDDVPISLAVQASTALPGVYPPVSIRDRYYVDGVLLKTLHASVALEAGVQLLFCVNPIVPVDTSNAVEAGVMRRGRLVNRGLPTLLSQTFRTLIHSRMRAGFAKYDEMYADRDIVLLEPERDDYRMFFTNVFRFSSRRVVCEHGYASARRALVEDAERLEPLLARHGIRLRRERLADTRRTPWSGLGIPEEDLEDTEHVQDRLSRLLDRVEDLVSENR